MTGNKPARFRKKPVEIEAIQWLGESNCEEVFAFLRMEHPIDETDHSAIFIPTLEGLMRADKGDWIVRGVKDELYPVKPDIFRMTYEPVSA